MRRRGHFDHVRGGRGKIDLIYFEKIRPRQAAPKKDQWAAFVVAKGQGVQIGAEGWLQGASRNVTGALKAKGAGNVPAPFWCGVEWLAAAWRAAVCAA
jgi:hypothetical protein